jgi:V/A-type H+-transporting ATPase subunit I
LINPVFKFIEIAPGYRELDISLWFLIFLSFFFGVIVGDAGYGAIYFALTLFFHRKSGHKIKDKSVIYLFYVFSLCAVIWGLLSGTIFGTAWLRGRFSPLVPALADDKFVRRLFFLVGATHLSIAHIWKIIIQLPSFIALTEVGWICILWASFFLARTLLLGDSLPPWNMILIISGCALVVFYSNPRKNIVNRILAGLGTLALNLMNNFTDVVSYIRLFAVGLAGVAVANAFNTMASSVAGMGVLSVILGGLILIAGHGLNIILGPMSVLVHGVRLNVLEFCMHLDVKWSGFAYKPLKEESV